METNCIFRFCIHITLDSNIQIICTFSCCDISIAKFVLPVSPLAEVAETHIDTRKLLQTSTI